MVDVKGKAEEIYNNKKSLYESLNATLLFQQALEAEVLELTDEVMSTYGVYFERFKEKIYLLCPTLNLSQMDFLKVVCDGELVDEEATTPLEPKNSAPDEDTHDEGGRKRGGEF